jgi:hypothetical protein
MSKVRCDCVDSNGNVWPDCTCQNGWREQPDKVITEAEHERDELRQQRDELAAANALIIKRVLAQLTTTKESPQWTTVDFNYMVASIRGTLSATDPAAILLAHDREKDQKIAELSGAWASLMKAIESDGGTLSVGGIPVGENVRALAQMHDAALVKPLVEALRTVQKSIEHRTDKSPYEVCYDWCPACQIDAALTPYRERTEYLLDQVPIPEGWQRVAFREPAFNEYFMSENGAIGYQDGGVSFRGRQSEHIIVERAEVAPTKPEYGLLPEDVECGDK